MAEVARFKIGPNTYTTASLDEISLRDMMLFDSQAKDMGLHVTWADVERISQEIDAMDEKAAENHPDVLILIGVTIWASRRTSGENVTLEEAVDFPIKDLDWIATPQDRKPSTAKRRPTTATRKAAASS